MIKAPPRATATVFALLVCVCTRLAHAGECVNDWPNPDDCFPDILCPQYSAYWDFRRAVVHLYGPDIGGTGVLIDNASCHTNDTQCGAPYLLTANHVVSGNYDQQMSPGQIDDVQTLTAFTFGLEAATCGGPTTNGAIALDGATVVAHAPEKDLLLLRLSTSLPPELGAYFVGWCGGPVAQAISMSHPCGAPKRIAISDYGEIDLVQVMNREVYDVHWWQEGALASGSSGAPLLDEQTGVLKGIFTDAVQAGSEACSMPSGTPAQDRFTALSSILEFLPASVDGGGIGCIGHFDSNEDAALLGTVETSSYYGPGEVISISAKNQVLLLDGFFADYDSTVTITIQP